MKQKLRSITLSGQTFLWRVKSAYFRSEDAHRTTVRLVPENGKTRVSIHFWTRAFLRAVIPSKRHGSRKKTNRDILNAHMPGVAAELAGYLLQRGVFMEGRAR